MDVKFMRWLVGMTALCALPAWVLAASLPSARTADESRAVVQRDTTADAAAHERADSVADSHLLLQYSLHRSSRYLYNPGDGAQLAGASGHVETVEH